MSSYSYWNFLIHLFNLLLMFFLFLHFSQKKKVSSLLIQLGFLLLSEKQLGRRSTELEKLQSCFCVSESFT